MSTDISVAHGVLAAFLIVFVSTMLGSVSCSNRMQEASEARIRCSMKAFPCSSSVTPALQYRTLKQQLRYRQHELGYTSCSDRDIRKRLKLSVHSLGSGAFWCHTSRALGLRTAALIEGEEDRRLQQLLLNDITDQCGLAMLMVLSSLGMFSGSALAEEVAYRGDAGNEFLKNFAGVAYIVVVVVFVIRLFKRRAATATSQVCI